MKIIIAPPGTPPPNTLENGIFYTINDDGITEWKAVPIENVDLGSWDVDCGDCGCGDDA